MADIIQYQGGTRIWSMGVQLDVITGQAAYVPAIQTVRGEILEHIGIRVSLLQLRHALRGDFGSRTTPGGDPDVFQLDLRDRMPGYAGDRRRGHCADGNDVRYGYVPQRTGHRYFLTTAAVTQANKEGRPDIGHLNIRHKNALQGASINHF
jgi:hypothetical protein